MVFLDSEKYYWLDNAQIIKQIIIRALSNQQFFSESENAHVKPVFASLMWVDNQIHAQLVTQAQCPAEAFVQEPVQVLY